MKNLLMSVVVFVLSLFAFVPSASAQEQRPVLQTVPMNWIYVGQVVDIDGLPVAAIGQLKRPNEEGNNSYVASTYMDLYGSIWIAPDDNSTTIQDGQYNFTISAEDFVMVRSVLWIQNGQVVQGGGTFLMKPGLRDTSLELTFDQFTGEIVWVVKARNRAILTPTLRVETIVYSEFGQFSVRQGEKYINAYSSDVIETVKKMSADKQEDWSPKDAGRYGHLNYLKLPEDLPAGEWIWGYVTITSANDRFNVRSKKHWFGVRTPQPGEEPLIHVY